MKIRSIKAIRMILSVLLILNAVLWFSDHYENLNAFHLIYSTCSAFTGILFMTNFWGIDKILMMIDDESITIKWFGKIRSKELFFNEIESINLNRWEIVIACTGKRTMKFRLDNLEVSQKKEVYDYFIGLSKDRGLNLVRMFDSQA